ncbi:MAG: sulfite exporter TauE/SafE family protein [Pseudomonadales bacterium]
MSLIEPGLIGLILVMCLAGAIAGITAGLFGIGGGFIVVPALLAVFPLFSHTDQHLIYVAIGTSLASIVVSSARAVQAHRRRGAVDFQVLKEWSPWLILGVAAGLYIASVTDGHRLYVVFAIGVLLYSIYFLLPDVFSRFTNTLTMPTGAIRAGLASVLGGFSALLGIGGGTVTVMTMVICNRPVHQAVATAAGVGFIIGLPGAIGFLIIGLGIEGLPWGSVGYINLPALAAISAMSIFTAPIGASWAHRLDESRLKRLFGVYLVCIAVAMYYKSLHI